jgi:outer membrane protein
MKDFRVMRSMLLAGVAFACAVLPTGPVLADQPVIADAPPAAPASMASDNGGDNGSGALPATLTDALVAAYNNNATLQEQRAVLRQTDENVPTALSGWRPQVSLSGSIGYDNETVIQQEYGSSTTTQYKYGQSAVQAQVTQNIFNGGKTLAQTREAKNQVYAARAQLLSTEQQVFLNVVQAYVTVVTDKQVLALQESNEDVLRQQLKDTTTQFNVGEITMTSVAQAQSSLAQAVEQVQVAQGNLKIAAENFRQLVGVYPADNLAPPQPLLLPVNSKEEAAAAAVANNPDVIAAEFSNAADKDAVDVAFSALMPQVQVQASAFHETGNDYLGSQLKGGSVIGQLTIPLYQGGQEYAAIRQARAKAQQSFASILDAERTAFYQGSQAWVAIVSTRAAIIAANEAIKANAIALDGTEREELVGTRTTLDVLNAQQLLLNSQVEQVQNIGTLVNNSYTVASAIGRLTVRDLGLPVQEYDDLKYYDAVKYAAFGTGESADHKAGIAPDGTLLDAPPAPAVASGPAP